MRQSPVQQEVLQQQESLPTASVLRIMPQLQAIAEILSHQTEAWDGSGNPDGLAYDNIPLESRIIRLVADFQRRFSYYKQTESESNPLMEALTDSQKLAGQIYDPKLVEALGLLVMGMQQGISLEIYQPKIAGGMWLID
jgi:response regulator RpfG family c-di-GMP phosphodiesterase